MSECASQKTELHTTIANLSDHQFPKDQLQACGKAGLFSSDSSLSPFHLFEIAAISIPTAFVLSQYRGAAERIAKWSKDDMLRKKISSGSSFATLGISQLSTSHQHTRPTLEAQQTSNGWRLRGFAPWVTGAHHAQYFILGALWSQKKTLFCVHKSQVHISVATSLITLNQCDTAQVHIDCVVDETSLLHVFEDEPATQTGSLRSIALAMGVTEQSISLINEQAVLRPPLVETLSQLQQEHQEHITSLSTPNIDRVKLRIRVNQLALQSAQQALVATKGKGLIRGEKAGNLCTQALFFLVWSCPQSVQNAHLNIGKS